MLEVRCLPLFIVDEASLSLFSIDHKVVRVVVGLAITEEARMLRHTKTYYLLNFSKITTSVAPYSFKTLKNTHYSYSHVDTRRYELYDM